MCGVQRRILKDEETVRDLGSRFDGLDELVGTALSRNERVAIDETPLHVLEAAHRVEVPLLVVVHGRLVTEPPVHRVRIDGDVCVKWVVVDPGLRDGHEAIPSPGLKHGTAESRNPLGRVTRVSPSGVDTPHANSPGPPTAPDGAVMPGVPRSGSGSSTAERHSTPGMGRIVPRPSNEPHWGTCLPSMHPIPIPPTLSVHWWSENSTIHLPAQGGSRCGCVPRV